MVMTRKWASTRPVFFPAIPGTSLQAVVLQSVQQAYRDRTYSGAQAKSLLRYARCRVDGIEIPRDKWATTFPPHCAQIEIFHGVRGGGGGGGGKNPVATVLSVLVVAVAMAATWYIGGLPAGATILGMTTGQASLAVGIAAMGSLMAVNALFPTAQASITAAASGTTAATTSQAYSISGAQNSANVNGVVPLILGRHRVTPPLGAKSWTKWEGNKQFFYMLVVWGHKDIEVSDFRLDETPLENYTGVDHQFHQATTGDDMRYFSKSYDEQTVGAVVKKSDGWVTRSIGECEDISVDLALTKGCTTISQTDGSPGWRSVQVQIQYADEGGDNWVGMGATHVNIKAASSQTNGVIFISANLNGELKFYTIWDIVKEDGNKYPINIYPAKDDSIIGCDVTVSEDWRASVTSGVYAPSSTTISEATLDLVVRNYAVEGLERKKRQVRIRRLTGDTNSSYIRDEITWNVVRAVLNQPAFATPIPICASELRILATEQLSGYVDNFNALCHSKIPDWDEGTQEWVTRTTSNPASIMRYLLTTRQGLAEPYTLAKMDDATLIELHKYAEENGCEFNFVADSELNTWARLVQVLSPARAAPTTDVDALWGVVIDKAGKEPVQMFTPRNSWGWKVDRGFVKMPHALRVKFLDETQDYDEVEQFVYMDGYSADGADGTEKASYVIEWDYPGVTSWEKLYQLAREHLARIMYRATTLTLNTDWEWMACNRGKLVRVYSDILMNTFGTARIQRLVYDIDGEEMVIGRVEDIPLNENGDPLIPIGVQLDDTVVYSEPSPARYGITIRNEQSVVTTYELNPEYGEEERDTLYFKYTLSAANIPQLRSLVSVSLLESGVQEDYLVASISHGDNNSAELTLIPYEIDNIKAAASGPIPPYTPSIILDVVRGKALPTPTIVQVRSDESVLISSTSGGTTPRIAAWTQMGTGTDDAATLTYQIMATDVELETKVFGTASSLDAYVACSGVTEGRIYAVRVRVVSGTTGKTSDWSAPVRHVVVGRTTPPPAPDAVNLDGYTLRITQSNRPLDVVGHVVKMVFDDTDPIGYGLTLTTPYTTTGTFDLTPWAGRARRVFVQTIDELGLLSDPVSVAIDLGDTIPDNLLFEYSERDKGWTGEIYGGHVTSEVLYANSTTTAWSADTTAAAWSTDSTYPAWDNGDGVQMSYAWKITFPKEYAGGRILVEPVALAGKLLSLEYRHYNDTPAWSAETTDPAWDNPVATTWAPLPETYTTAGRDTVEFRATYASGEVATLADIVTSIDVPDRDWAVEDLEISAAGTTHIPLPADTFRAVTNVVSTLQYRDGDTAVTTARVPGTEEVGDDGYLELGPIILALDSNRNSVAASADVRIKGY